MREILKPVLTLAALVLIVGCTSTGNKQAAVGKLGKFQVVDRRISVMTVPSGAIVYQKMPDTGKLKKLGLTPLTAIVVKVKTSPVDPYGRPVNGLSSNEKVTVVVEKKGYQKLETDLITSRHGVAEQLLPLRPIAKK